MSLFGFEKSFIDAVNEIEVKGFRKHYADIFTETVECIIDERNVVYDTNDNIMEDQNRYLYMVSSGALVEVKSTAINEGVKLTDLQRGSYLHEEKAYYMITLESSKGKENIYVSKLGEFLYANPSQSPKNRIVVEAMNSRYGFGVLDFSEVTSLTESNLLNSIEKKIGLSWTAKSVKKIY